jgi:dTDP-4-dehydrorhamnose reductase
MIALLTGAGGQLGRALQSAAPAGTRLKALTHAELDVADEAAVREVLRAVGPALVINAAAFTRVDEAESRAADALRINGTGPAVLAAACRDSRAWLVHVSTDYVFDGTQNLQYTPSAQPNPLSVYGRTKLAGELAVRQVVADSSTVVRTSWLYAAGHRNFLTTMLQRMAAGAPLRVVSDQVGAPTTAAGLAGVLWALAGRRASGIYHWCDSGVASWYDFAVAIGEEAQAAHLLGALASVTPISAQEYPTPAQRPRYSVLDKRDTERLLGNSAPHWRVSLREVLRQLAAQRTPASLA